jgi:hypothetical protein
MTDIRQRRSKAHLFRRPDELPPIEAVTRTIEVANTIFCRATWHRSAYTVATKGSRKIPMSLPRVKWLERNDA